MKHQGFRQPLAWMLITVHLATISGCSTTNYVTLPGNEIPVGSNLAIATVILKDGEIIEFDGKRGLYVERVRDGKSYRVIVGTTNSKDVEIDPEKVLEVKFEQKESNGTGSFIIGFLLGIPVGSLVIYLIAMALSSR